MEKSRSELLGQLKFTPSNKLDNRAYAMFKSMHTIDDTRVVYYPSNHIVADHANIVMGLDRPKNIRIKGFNHFLVFGEDYDTAEAYRFITVGDKLLVGIYFREGADWILDLGYRVEPERGKVYATAFYSRAATIGNSTSSKLTKPIEDGATVIELLNHVLTVIPMIPYESSNGEEALPTFYLDFNNPKKGVEPVVEVKAAPVKTATSRKLDLMSKIVLAGKMKMRKEHEYFVKMGLDISPSILFVEIKSNAELEKKSVHYNFADLPFPDTMFLCTMEVIDSESVSVHNNLLIRIRQKKDGNVYIMTYRELDNGKLSFMSLMEVNVSTGEHSRILPSDESGYGAVVDDMHVIILKTARQAMFTTLNFERVVKTDPTRSFSVKKKINKRDIPLYLEYTLDKSKAVKYGNISRGGTHRSPIEHERMGHYRHYKNGKIIFIEATVINKGKGGRIEKDYIV